MNKKYQGIICIIASAFFFALMNLFVKLSGDIPVIQKSFFRNAVAVIFAVIILTKNKSWQIPKGKNLTDLIFRSVAGTIGIFCNFYAVSHINIADASILNKLSPFFAIIFSVILLKEKANVRQIVAVSVAFIGALLVMRPTISLDFLPSFIGFLGGLSAGLAYTFVRKVTLNGIKGPMVVFFFSAFSSIVTLPFVIFDFTPMSASQWICLALAGLCASGGQIFITMAYSKAPAKEISIYDYTQIIFAMLISLFVFSDIPDTLSIIGYVVIIFAAIFNAWHNIRPKNQVRI